MLHHLSDPYELLLICTLSNNVSYVCPCPHVKTTFTSTVPAVVGV